MSRAIGIDLGTTNSCVAVLEGEDEAVVIPNAEGSRTTPSVVAFTEGGDRLVGQIAKRQAVTNPENTIHAVKRLLGRKFNDERVQRMRRSTVYQIVEADNGDARVRVHGRDYAPPEISAIILASLKEVAQAYVGEPITEAVITVPAYFDDAQRQATTDSGRIAGLDVLRIVNEPTAAALAYGMAGEDADAQRIAVYDLGGGTFDISILELRQGVFEVRATSGDTFLGGVDFDWRIIDHLASEFAEAHEELDLRKDKMALQRLLEAAEKAKHELSAALETDINLPFITASGSGTPLHLSTGLSRSKLEALTDDLVASTLEPCKQALSDAGIDASAIDAVILVGGQTRMPRVQERVSEFFGREPSKRMDPDEVVAAGAAIQSAVVTGDVSGVVLLDVTPLSLGVETAGGVFTPLIPRNTTIPTRESEIFSTAVDNQPLVNVHVLQGERPMAKDNKSLAHFQLVGLPPAPRGVPQIEVSFDIDANCLVNVTARDLGTGKEQRVKVVPSTGLSEAEIQRMIEEAETHRESDLRKKDEADLRNNVETLIYTTEGALREYGELLEEADLKEIEDDLQLCKAALRDSSTDEITRAMQQLQDSSGRLASVVYEDAGQ